MRKRGIHIGARQYRTQKDAVEAVRRILNGAPLGQPIDGNDLALLVDLFDQHPGAIQKAPDGICSVVVRQIEWRPGILQRCFFAIRPDGTEIDWSYRVALGIAPCGPTFAQAARGAISERMVAYRLSRFAGRDTMPCDISGEPIGFYEAHVDHAQPWPFSRILAAYEAEHGASALRVIEPYDCGFADPADEACFVGFHDARAVLRIVHWRANLAKGARA